MCVPYEDDPSHHHCVLKCDAHCKMSENCVKDEIYDRYYCISKCDKSCTESEDCVRNQTHGDYYNCVSKCSGPCRESEECVPDQTHGGSYICALRCDHQCQEYEECVQYTYNGGHYVFCVSKCDCDESERCRQDPSDSDQYTCLTKCDPQCIESEEMCSSASNGQFKCVPRPPTTETIVVASTIAVATTVAIDTSTEGDGYYIWWLFVVLMALVVVLMALGVTGYLLYNHRAKVSSQTSINGCMHGTARLLQSTVHLGGGGGG